MRQGKFEDALESFKKAIANDENVAVSAINAAVSSLELKNEQNLLQFVPFSKKISRPDPFAAFSNDMNRLYSRLSDNYQIFIPIN